MSRGWGDGSRAGVIHTLKVGGKQADIIVMVPVHAGNPDEYLVRFDGPRWDTLDRIEGMMRRFKCLDAAKIYAIKVLFGGSHEER